MMPEYLLDSTGSVRVALIPVEDPTPYAACVIAPGVGGTLGAQACRRFAAALIAAADTAERTVGPPTNE